MKYIKLVLSILCFCSYVFFNTNYVFAIIQEECEAESDCITCKQDLRCLKCMDACYNKFGNADENRLNEKYDVAKQCIADCWDPPKK